MEIEVTYRAVLTVDASEMGEGRAAVAAALAALSIAEQRNREVSDVLQDSLRFNPGDGIYDPAGERCVYIAGLASLEVETWNASPGPELFASGDPLDGIEPEPDTHAPEDRPEGWGA